jgi:hypothetical protein
MQLSIYYKKNVLFNHTLQIYICSMERTNTRWFKSNRVQTPELANNVDAKLGVLTGVVLCQEGESKGHGTHLEKSFIKDIVKLAKGRKIKSRFGHPSMSNEALGTYLGTIEKVRYRENDEGIGQAIGDLHLSESSKISPNGNLSAYVIKAAQEHPENFGLSIVFRPGENYYYNSKGKKVFTDYWTAKDAEDNEDKKVYETINELLATDMVDEGAATDSLFSASSFFNSEAFAVKATNFLDENPQILEFLDSNPEKIAPFIEKYLQYKQKKSEAMSKPDDKKTALQKFSDFGKTLFGSTFSASVKEEEKESETEQEEATETEEAAKKSDAENAQLAAITAETNALKAKNEALEKSNAELEAKIELLSKMPSAEETVPVTSEETSKAKPSFYSRIAEFHAQTNSVHK